MGRIRQDNTGPHILVAVTIVGLILIGVFRDKITGWIEIAVIAAAFVIVFGVLGLFGPYRKD